PMTGWSMAHLIAVPILLPLLAAGVMAGLGEQRRAFKATLGLLTCLATLGVAITLLLWVDREQAPGAFGVYLPGNWPVPFGIVLAVDRLSALMLVLAGASGLATLLFSLAR